jgi:predicted nucleic acid-binding protein
MYAVDTSSLIAYLRGDSGADVLLVSKLIDTPMLALPYPVVVEALSNKDTRASVEPALRKLKVLELEYESWFRASALRALLLSKNLKANLADTLIAQSCIDHDVALITRDEDFRHFAKWGKLKLAC